MTATDKEYAMQTIGIYGRVSKSFGWAKTLIGLGASHNITDYSMLVSGIVNDARMNTTAVSFDYSLRPARFLSVEGKSNVNIYKLQNSFPTRRPTGNISLNYMFSLPKDGC